MNFPREGGNYNLRWF